MGHSKNADGLVSTAETTIGLEPTDDNRLEELTFKLDGPLQVLGGRPLVTLSP